MNADAEKKRSFGGKHCGVRREAKRHAALDWSLSVEARVVGRDARPPDIIGLRRSMFDVRCSVFRSAFALVSILSLAPLAHAQTNRPAGTVVTWGYQFLPYLAPGTRFTAIAAGNSHTVALKSDGAVLAWGVNDAGRRTTPVAAESGVVAIAAGGGHTVALKSDGSVVAWGNNGNGQTTVPVAAKSGVVAIAAGASHS